MATVLNSDLRHLLVFGARSTALEIAETARDLWPGVRVTRVCGDREDMPGDDVVRIGELPALLSSQRGRTRYILSMTNQTLRRDCHARAESLGLDPITVVHSSAVISSDARIGAGTYVAACACVSARASIAEHCLINFHCVIGHDVELGTHVVVNPAASIGGNVHIGARTLIGANSFVLQGKTLGLDVVVDAMTYIDRDVPDASIASARRATRLQIVARPGLKAPRKTESVVADA